MRGAGTLRRLALVAAVLAGSVAAGLWGSVGAGAATTTAAGVTATRTATRTTTRTATVTRSAQTRTANVTRPARSSATVAHSTTVQVHHSAPASGGVPTWGWVLIAIGVAGLVMGAFALGRGRDGPVRGDDVNGGPRDQDLPPR